MTTKQEFEAEWTARINKFMELYQMVPDGIEDDLRKSLANIQAVVNVASNGLFHKEGF